MDAMKKEIKSHLLIQDRFLGALLYFKDKNDRGCLKLSFKNKIANFAKNTDVPTALPVPLILDNPMRLDVSYKFQDSLLEVKKIIDGKVEPEFYKVPLPISNVLFFIQIKNWHLLDVAKPSSNPLILIPPSQSNSIVIIFSFLGANNLPFNVKNYICPNGMGTIDLPETPLNKLCIGIADDIDDTDVNGFKIGIPFPPALDLSTGS
jgi:hypothetical protein